MTPAARRVRQRRARGGPTCAVVAGHPDLLDVGDTGAVLELLGGAIVGWLVQLVGETVVAAGSGRRKLGAAVNEAVRTVLVEIQDADARKSLRAALVERFTEPPMVPGGDGSDVRQWLVRAVSTQPSPLADPENAIGGRAYLEHIGVSHRWLVDRLTRAMVAAIYQVASATDFSALATRLGIEELRDELRRDPDQRAVSRSTSTGPGGGTGWAQERQGSSAAMAREGRPISQMASGRPGDPPSATQRSVGRCQTGVARLPTPPSRRPAGPGA